ncbi:MAG TPA: secretin N-terminal domain-containing protein, partial [Nevskiaceae bacterium]|nr:secretin N-terminal domain-containing protein [Nevskiaceae bacterium]
MNTHPPQPHRILLLPLAAALLAACASDPLLPPPMVFTPRSDAAGVITGEAALTREPAPPPTVPGGRSRSTVGEGGGRIQVRNEGGLSEYATFDQVPLAALVQTVLADILGRNVTVDPEVMQRRDVVTFRMPPGQTRRQVADAVQQLLKSYGVALIDEGELVRVAADSSRAGYLPEIARGAALPETPQSLRPLFQLVELGAVRNNEVAGWISTLFEGRVAVKEDAARNAVVLSGSPEHVAAAVEAIKILDRPLMAGRASARFAPTYWSAEELAKRLTEILAAEGYSMPPVNWSPTQPGARYPIILLPVSALNVVLVFAVDPGVIPHIERWVAQLDQYSEDTPDKSIFSYAARYTTAANL